MNESKRNMIYPHNGKSFYNKKEWTTHICYSMDESCKQYAKYEKPVTNDHIWYDSVYMKCPDQAHL